MNAANTGCPEGARSLAWAYGEAPDDALDHIVGCAECTQLVAEIEQVEAAVATVRPALARPQRRRWPVLFAVSALAAAAMLVTWWAAPADGDVPQATPTVDIAFQDDLDDRLDDLDASLVGLDDPDLL